MKYYHYRGKNSVTIAGEFIGDHLYMAASRTSNRDQFNKKTGCKLAEQRFNEKKYFKVSVPEETLQNANNKNWVEKPTWITTGVFFTSQAKELAIKINKDPSLLEDPAKKKERLQNQFLEKAGYFEEVK